MMLEQNKRTGLVRGCLVPLLTVIGLMFLCFAICAVLYNVNYQYIPRPGGAFFFFFGN